VFPLCVPSRLFLRLLPDNFYAEPPNAFAESCSGAEISHNASRSCREGRQRQAFPGTGDNTAHCQLLQLFADTVFRGGIHLPLRMIEHLVKVSRSSRKTRVGTGPRSTPRCKSSRESAFLLTIALPGHAEQSHNVIDRSFGPSRLGTTLQVSCCVVLTRQIATYSRFALSPKGTSAIACHGFRLVQRHGRHPSFDGKTSDVTTSRSGDPRRKAVNPRSRRRCGVQERLVLVARAHGDGDVAMGKTDTRRFWRGFQCVRKRSLGNRDGCERKDHLLAQGIAPVGCRVDG
jgi:hypothetical protein